MLTCILTKNRCYLASKTIKPKGVMVHSTGANNPNLSRYVQPADSMLTEEKKYLLNTLGVNRYKNDWNNSNVDVCVHAFIGKTATGQVEAVQTLPWTYRAWHCASGNKGSGNNTHISFEICEDDLTDATYFNQAYNKAVELTAYLCNLYSLNPIEDGVVICHKEGCDRGIASAHGDVLHWFPKFGKTMDDFRSDVLSAMCKPKKEETSEMQMKIYKTLADVPAWYSRAIEKCIEQGALKGTGNAEINVSEDLCRTLTILDRLGKLDK